MRKFTGVILGVALTLLVSSVALAEGNWTSFLSNVNRGFDSRWWHDADSDSVSTQVRFDTCRDDVANGSSDWAAISLWRGAGLFPPYLVGNSKTLHCWVTDTIGWGSQDGGADFLWNVDDYSGGTGPGNRLDVNFLKTSY